LGSRDPLDALAETPGRIQELVLAWPAERFERGYAPGKWSARQVLIHLAQTEMALGSRARFALSAEGYAAQAFSQDLWMAFDQGAGAAVALDAYTALRRLNLALLSALTPEQRDRPFSHPEYGTLTVWWIAAQLAGHDLHHLEQLARIE
jgi:hypothetical protein